MTNARAKAGTGTRARARPEGHLEVRPPLETRRETDLGTLVAAEPSERLLVEASGLLADFYNDPHNAELLGNTVVFSSKDVVQLWRDAKREGARNFLLWRDDSVVGDGDFRRANEKDAELALLIGPRELQGIGLGRHFAAMMLALGFDHLGLERVFVAIRPSNAASLRLFESFGFARDASPAARTYAEDEDDVCMSLLRQRFFGPRGGRGG